MNQYDRLRAEESAAGSKAMFAARSNARKSKAPRRCPLCSCTGHTAQGCKEYVVTKRDQKSGGQRTDFNSNRGGDGSGSGSGGRNGGGSKVEAPERQKRESDRCQDQSHSLRVLLL